MRAAVLVAAIAACRPSASPAPPPSPRVEVVTTSVHGRGLEGNVLGEFIARELVAEIDRRYRTIARPEARGIAGHSMGGYGALVLGGRHPEVFGTVYAMAPCCVAWVGDLSSDERSWRRALAAKSLAELMAFAEQDDLLALGVLSIAAAWSPDPTAPPLYVAWPFTEVDGKLAPGPGHARWQAATALASLEREPESWRKLRAIAIDAGHADRFTHIPAGVRLLAAALQRRGIAHAVELYDGDHGNRIGARRRTSCRSSRARSLADYWRTVPGCEASTDHRKSSTMATES